MFVLLAFQHKTLQFQSVMTVTAFSAFAFETYVIFNSFCLVAIILFMIITFP